MHLALKLLSMLIFSNPKSAIIYNDLAVMETLKSEDLPFLDELEFAIMNDPYQL